MYNISFLNPLRWVKWASGRGVGAPRRSRRTFRSDSLQRLETRQLLAGSITRSMTFAASVPLQVTDFTAGISLPKFSPSMGTLTEVDLSITTGGAFTGTVTNNGADPQSFSIAEEISLVLSQGTTSLLNPKLDASQSFAALAGGGSADFGPFSPIQAASATYTSGPTFDQFDSGPGDANLSLATTTSQTSTGAGGNIASNLVTNAGAVATVTYVYNVATVSLSGHVYNDADATGTLTPGDPPIPGTTLFLVGPSGSIVASTTTAPDGTYSFTTDSSGNPLLAGTYTIDEDQPAGFLQGTNTVGTVDGVTTGALTGRDLIGSITLNPGQDSINNNFGEVLPVGLAGTVYEDVNGTGSLVAGDKPIGGVTLTLFGPGGVVVQTTTTDAQGNYSFTVNSSGIPLFPGIYSIGETQPSGYLQGSNTVGTVDGVTDGILPTVDVIGTIGLLSGQASLHNNFGEVLPVGVAGTVYDDVKRAGFLLPGDTPIGGVGLSLFNPSGLVATTTTDVNGNYSFITSTSGAALHPGTYTLVETQPAGYLQGFNTVGNVNGVAVGNLPATDVIGSIALTSGQASLQNDFGEVLPAPTPVHLTNIQRFGVHLQPTLLVLTFDAPLDPATAQNIANYQLLGPTDSKSPARIPIESATYNPATDMVTLRLSERLNVHHPYQLTVVGLQTPAGGLLVGTDGSTGGTVSVTFNRAALAGFTDIYGNFIPIDHGKLYPAATASGYQLKRFVAPTNLGSFARTNTAAFLAATAGSPEIPPIDLRRGKKL